MILNVSGRTDIVAFYSEWFKKRYEEGYFDVRNPFYPMNVNRIKVENIDLILFCTKNPLPIIDYLEKMNKPIIFHVTLTPYNKDIEPNVISKTKIIDGIKKISKILGKDKVYVRYDPIFLNNKYDVNYHIKAFDKLCKLLNGYVDNIIVSFIDDYKNVRHNLEVLKYHEPTKEELELIGTNFSKIASKNNINVFTCAEENNLSEYGFSKGECMSASLAYSLTGKRFPKWKSRNCNCVEMVDIGAYNSCSHFCKYCYANFDEKQVKDNMKNHDSNSSLLVGHLKDTDIIKERK